MSGVNKQANQLIVPTCMNNCAIDLTSTVCIGLHFQLLFQLQETTPGGMDLCKDEVISGRI